MAGESRSGWLDWRRGLPAATMTNPDHGALLTSAALSIDATMVAASDARGRTYQWDAKTGAPVHVLQPPDGSVADCASLTGVSGCVM